MDRTERIRYEKLDLHNKISKAISYHESGVDLYAGKLVDKGVLGIGETFVKLNTLVDIINNHVDNFYTKSSPIPFAWKLKEDCMYLCQEDLGNSVLRFYKDNLFWERKHPDGSYSGNSVPSRYDDVIRIKEVKKK